MNTSIYLNPSNVEHYLKEPYCKSGNRLAYSTPLATTIFSQLNQLIYYNIADNVFIADQDEIVASYIVNSSNEAKEAANVAGKILSSVKTQIQYNKMIQSKSHIGFMDV
jgi:hypothetical protein